MRNAGIRGVTDLRVIIRKSIAIAPCPLNLDRTQDVSLVCGWWQGLVKLDL